VGITKIGLAHTVKRLRHILLTMVQIPRGPGLTLHGHFWQPHVADKTDSIYYGCLHCTPHVTDLHGKDSGSNLGCDKKNELFYTQWWIMHSNILYQQLFWLIKSIFLSNNWDKNKATFRLGLEQATFTLRLFSSTTVPLLHVRNNQRFKETFQTLREKNCVFFMGAR